MNWGAWSAFEGGVGRPLQEVDRKTAQAYFDAFMAARGERRRHLEELLARNGVAIGMDDAGLQRLDDWYARHVEPHPVEPDRLTDRWYAVGLDIGVYLGEAMIERAPNLEWRLMTAPPGDFSYQRPVIMGFQVKNPRYNADPEQLLAIYGHRIVAGEEDRTDFFVQLVRSAVSKAGAAEGANR
jgi:hypothetical protein